LEPQSAKEQGRLVIQSKPSLGLFFLRSKKKIIKSEIVEQKQAQGEQKKSGIIAVFDDVCMSELINLIERSSHDDWRGGKGEV